MALPAIAAGFVGRVAAWTGVSAVLTRGLPQARRFLSGLPNRLRNVLPQNVATALGIGGGAVGGFGLSEIFDRLGIEDSRIQKLSIAAVAALLLIGVGQILDLDIEL